MEKNGRENGIYSVLGRLSCPSYRVASTRAANIYKLTQVPNLIMGQSVSGLIS